MVDTRVKLFLQHFRGRVFLTVTNRLRITFRVSGAKVLYSGLREEVVVNVTCTDIERGFITMDGDRRWDNYNNRFFNTRHVNRDSRYLFPEQLRGPLSIFSLGTNDRIRIGTIRWDVPSKIKKRKK